MLHTSLSGIPDLLCNVGYIPERSLPSLGMELYCTVQFLCQADGVGNEVVRRIPDILVHRVVWTSRLPECQCPILPDMVCSEIDGLPHDLLCLYQGVLFQECCEFRRVGGEGRVHREPGLPPDLIGKLQGDPVLFPEIPFRDMMVGFMDKDEMGAACLLEFPCSFHPIPLWVEVDVVVENWEVRKHGITSSAWNDRFSLE